jgi:thioredoxin reductase
MQHRLRFATIEQDSFGGTVAHFPRGKLVMTAPAILPLIGKVKFREISKEKLLEFWGRAARDTGLRIRYGERVESVAANGGGFEVKTNRATYPTRSIVLAIGRRGTPRKLDIPGEELPKVVYRVVDPAQYRGQNVLVVGGGDSALEAAASIAEEPGATVTLSYRSENFSRAKMKNRQRVAAARHAGRLDLLMPSQVERIAESAVQLTYRGERITIRNEAVIVCVGGILPTPFLQNIGIEVQTKYGTA